MKIQTIHKLKMPNDRKIKGINWILNRITLVAENILIRKNDIRGCVKPGSRKQKVILSMTSYPERNTQIQWTIKSLMNQSVTVDHFILWLAEEQYPNRIIPQEIEQYRAYGLEVKFCEDLKSHKKYYYAMQNYPDAIVITVDDDVIYPEDTLEKLLKAHDRNPNAVICNHARWITLEKGVLKPYRAWRVSIPSASDQPDLKILPIGEGGVLYPPDSLDKQVFSKACIRKYALSADDLWLKSMAMKKGTMAAVSEMKQRGLCSVIGRNIRSDSLESKNVNGGENDRTIDRLLQYYGESIYTVKRYFNED